MIYVPQAAETKVAKQAQRYRGLRKARAQLAKMSQESLDIIDQLECLLTTSEEIRVSTAKAGGMTTECSRKKK